MSPSPVRARRTLGVLAAATLALAGCAAPVPDFPPPAPPLAAAQRPQAVRVPVVLDLAGFTGTMRRRRLQGLGFHEPDVAALHVAVEAADLEEPVTAVVAEAVGDAAPVQPDEETTVVEVAPGTNRLITVEARDADGHVLARMRTLGDVAAGADNAFAITPATDAAARVLAAVLAAQDDQPDAAVLGTAGLADDLQAFVDGFTDPDDDGATYHGVNPLRFRAGVLAEHLLANGAAALAADPADEDLADALELEAGTDATFRVEGDAVAGRLLEGPEVTLAVFDPLSGEPLRTASGALRVGQLPPGEWPYRVTIGDETTWGLARIDEDVDGTAEMTVTVGSTTRPAAIAWVSTLAGAAGTPASRVDGQGAAARFRSLGSGFAVRSDGRVYTCDGGDGDDFQVVTTAGTVSTLAITIAGGGTIVDPESLAFAPGGTGELFVANWGGEVFRVSDAGVATRIAGPRPDAASEDLIVTADGTIYVLDMNYYDIRRLTPTAPGAGTYTSQELPIPDAFEVYIRDGRGMAVGPDGAFYVADAAHHCIRRVHDQDGAWVAEFWAGLKGERGHADGDRLDARFYYPGDLEVDDAGNLYVADAGNHVLRMITPDGVVSTIAGAAGTRGAADGPGDEARFESPDSLAMDANGRLLVADAGNRAIRVVELKNRPAAD